MLPAIHSRQERDQLIVKWQYLPKHVVNRLHLKGMVPFHLLDDAVSIGTVALVRAAETFDPTKAKFSTYAYLVIQRDVVTAMIRTGRHERAVHPMLDGDEFDVPEPTELEDPDIDPEHLVKAMDRLPEVFRLVLQAAYWQGLTMGEIGKRMGKSRAWACWIRRKALAQLREELKPKVQGG